MAMRRLRLKFEKGSLCQIMFVTWGYRSFLGDGRFMEATDTNAESNNISLEELELSLHNLSVVGKYIDFDAFSNCSRSLNVITN